MAFQIDPNLKDFRNFLAAAWHQLKLKPPTRLQMDVAKQLQNGGARLVLMCFRGFGKSWIASTRNCHNLYLNADRKVLNVSAAARKANETNQFMLQLIEKMPELRHLKPRRDQRRSNIEFDVDGALPAHAPSARSLGIESNSIVGSRADQILADDVETVDNAQTVVMQEKVARRCQELGGAVLRSVDDYDDGYVPQICYLGTPQIENSFYFSLRKNPDYQVMIYPARYPTEEQEESYHGCLAPILQEDLARDPSLRGQPTEPTRFGEDVLEERLREYLAPGFALQFMLLPALADPDRYPLSLNDLMVMDCDADTAPEKVIWNTKPENVRSSLPQVGFSGRDYWREPFIPDGAEWVPYNHAIMAIDPATVGSDECAYVVLKILNSQAFLVDAGGFLDGGKESTLRKLANIAKEWRVKQVVLEKNYGGGMYRQLLQPILLDTHVGCGIEEINVVGQKERRIAEVLGPLLRQHRLVVDPMVIRKDFKSTQHRKGTLGYQLFWQMSRLTLDRGCLPHYDRLDALALGIQHLVDNMGRNYKREIAARKAREFEQGLRDWKARVISPFSDPKPDPEPTWMI